MTSSKKRLVSLIIVVSFLFSYASGVQAATANITKITQFVERCYSVILSRDVRNVTGGGKQYWIDALANGRETGVSITQNFFFSQEYKNRNRTDAQFVQDLYKAFMDREIAANVGGAAYWQRQLSEGATDYAIFVGFAISPEFSNVCRGYGITVGSAFNTGDLYCRANKKIDGFVDLVYQVFLGKTVTGPTKAYWVNNLKSKSTTAAALVQGILFASEYQAKNKSNEAFIRDLYGVFLRRSPTAAELNNWKNSINNGTTDYAIVANFLTLSDFVSYCTSAGMSRGSLTTGQLYARNKSETITFTITLPTGQRVVMSGFYDYACENEIATQLNAYRTASGLRAVTRPSSLSNTAHIRCREISAYFSHTRPNNQICFSAFPTNYGWAGENIAAGQINATAVMNSWKTSSGHNQNMLNGNYTAVGIGVLVITSGNSTYGRYYAQCFGG